MPDSANTIVTNWVKNGVPDSQTTRKESGEAKPAWVARHCRLIESKLDGTAVEFLICEALGVKTPLGNEMTVAQHLLAHYGELLAALD